MALDGEALTRELTDYFLSPGSSLADDCSFSPLLVTTHASQQAQPTRPEPIPHSSSAASLTKVQIFKWAYSSSETLAFFSVNVGPRPGVYYGKWSDVVPLVQGQKARPSFTTHYDAQKVQFGEAGAGARSSIRTQARAVQAYPLCVPVRGVGSPEPERRPGPANVPLSVQAANRNVPFGRPPELTDDGLLGDEVGDKSPAEVAQAASRAKRAVARAATT